MYRVYGGTRAGRYSARSPDIYQAAPVRQSLLGGGSGRGFCRGFLRLYALDLHLEAAASHLLGV